MRVTPWVIAIVGIASALVAGRFASVFYRRAEKFEAQARLALDHEHTRQIEVDLLEADKVRLVAQLHAQHARTVKLVQAVAVVDSISPPDTSCAPNLAARDSVIVSQSDEIQSLTGVNAAQAGQINLLQASTIEMRRALEARPKLYPRFVGPSIGVGVFAGVVGLRPDGKPSYGVGVGVTVNVFSVRL